MSSCQSCGAVLVPDTRFCHSCGSSTELAANLSAVSAGGSAAAAVFPAPGQPGAKSMDTNVVGALTYLAGFITGILFLVLNPYKSNSFVRFHAFQSIFFNVAWVAFWIVWMIVSGILTHITAGLFAFIALPLMLIFTVGGFGLWLFLMFQAYQQKLFKLPIVGKLAAQQGGVSL